MVFQLRFARSRLPLLRLRLHSDSSTQSELQRQNRGSAVTELAVTIFPFLLLILGLVQLAIVGFTAVGLQYAANKAIRWASVGNITSRASRSFAEIETRVKDQVRSVGLDDSDVVVSVCPNNNRTCGGQVPGASRQFVVLTIRKPAMSVFGVGRFEVGAEVLVKNEPF